MDLSSPACCFVCLSRLDLIVSVWLLGKHRPTDRPPSALPDCSWPLPLSSPPPPLPLPRQGGSPSPCGLGSSSLGGLTKAPPVVHDGRVGAQGASQDPPRFARCVCGCSSVVEHLLAKERVESSNLFIRLISFRVPGARLFLPSTSPGVGGCSGAAFHHHQALLAVGFEAQPLVKTPAVGGHQVHPLGPGEGRSPQQLLH